MARLSKAYKHLTFEYIAEIYSTREQSLRLFCSELNPDYESFFLGYTSQEITEYLEDQLAEVDRDACLNILAAIEALFRIDYAIRCEDKDREAISRQFRGLFAEYQYRISLEDKLFEEWKTAPSITGSIMSDLKGAFKYRHWLAHGRYWVPRLGQQYDFNGLYILAMNVNSLPLKRA
jgi:hypothetical protein